MANVNQQYNLAIQVRSTDCIHCGMIILMSQDFREARQGDHKSFFCISCGKGQYWPQKSDVEVLRAELESANRRAQVHRDMAASERAAREQTQRQLRATRGAKTRIVNRIKNGVCPCCNRTFINLGQHMQSQHPDFQKVELSR